MPEDVGQEPDASGQVPQPEAERAPSAPAAAPAPAVEREQDEPDEVRTLRREAASYRRRLRELEQQLRQREEEELSEAERLRRRLEELERERDTWARERRERTVRYEVMLAASRLGIVDPDAAYRLLDVDQIELDDDGRPRDLDRALKELLRRRPYLAGASQAPTNPARGSSPSLEDALRSGDHAAINAAFEAALREARR